MAGPLIPAALVAVRVMGKGIQYLTKKQADKAVKEGWGSTVKPKKPYAQIKKERQAELKVQRKEKVAKKKSQQQERARQRKEGTDYTTRLRKAWWKLTPAQRKKAGQSLANLEKSISESTKAAKPSKVSGRQKGMQLPRKGETNPLRKRGGTVSRKSGSAMGISPKAVKDVKRLKRRKAAQKMADVEKDVTEDVKRGEWIARDAQSVAETGGIEGGLLRAIQNLQKSAATRGWLRTPSPRDITKAEAITRGQKRAVKERARGRAAPPEESVGLEHTAPYKTIIRAIKGNKSGGKVSRKKGGKVSRKSGGKIMYGYKAGGRV